MTLVAWLFSPLEFELRFSRHGIPGKWTACDSSVHDAAPDQRALRKDSIGYPRGPNPLHRPWSAPVLRLFTEGGKRTTSQLDLNRPANPGSVGPG